MSKKSEHLIERMDFGKQGKKGRGRNPKSELFSKVSRNKKVFPSDCKLGWWIK